MESPKFRQDGNHSIELGRDVRRRKNINFGIGSSYRFNE